VPAVSVTVPLGVAPVPLTVTGTLRLDEESTVLDTGETVTVGVNRLPAATVTKAVPVAVP
jgi:hypothetical protein